MRVIKRWCRTRMGTECSKAVYILRLLLLFLLLCIIRGDLIRHDYRILGILSEIYFLSLCCCWPRWRKIINSRNFFVGAFLQSIPALVILLFHRIDCKNVKDFLDTNLVTFINLSNLRPSTELHTVGIFILLFYFSFSSRTFYILYFYIMSIERTRSEKIENFKCEFYLPKQLKSNRAFIPVWHK